MGLANQVMAFKDTSRCMRSPWSHGRHGGGGEIAAMAATCGGSRDPRTTPNLLPASAALLELPHQIRSNPRQNHTKEPTRKNRYEPGA